MLEAFVLGALGQTSLVLAGLLAYVTTFPPRVIGSLAAFGAGSLIGAIAFDLLPDAEELASGQGALWLLIGAGVFVVADALIERLTAPNEAAGSEGAAAEGESSGGPLGIVVGSIVDGVPESVIFGIGVATGQPLSIGFLFAVWISNIPQALAPSAELVKSGWPAVRLAGMWVGGVLACGIAAALGFAFGAVERAALGARMSAFAAGGLLAMLTNSLIPFSYERAGAQAGIWAVVGFALALATN